MYKNKSQSFEGKEEKGGLSLEDSGCVWNIWDLEKKGGAHQILVKLANVAPGGW